jgi:glycosyltransferase involved in cell wall biosynthesis
MSPQDDKPNILFVSPFSSLYGGELSFLEIVTGLNPDRYHLHAAVGGEGPLTDRLKDAGIQVKSYNFAYMSYRGLPALLFAVRLVPTVLSLAAYIRKNHFTLVYNNSLFNPYGSLAAWLAGVPCLWHIHDLGNNPLIKALITRLVGAISKKVVVVSGAVKSIFPESTYSKIRLVYNGVDADEFDPALFDRQAIRAELDIPADRPVALSVGRLHEIKRPQDTFEAVRQLIQRIPDLLLLVAGTGDLEAELRQFIDRYGLHHNIRMLGYRYDVARLLSATDVLVLSSGRESFGRILIEAMAMKIPVVSIRSGGIPEVVSEDCGILVPPASPSELAAALELILTNPEMAQRMGEAARLRVMERFSFAQCINGLEQVIQEIVSETTLDHLPRSPVPH